MKKSAGKMRVTIEHLTGRIRTSPEIAPALSGIGVLGNIGNVMPSSAFFPFREVRPSSA